MKRKRRYRVKEVARIAGISVRALHHYDEIGLLVPSARSGSGYRLYDDDGLLRLQQILIGRELGLSLEEIRRSLDDPRFDKKRALLEQREQLQRRVERTTEMILAVDKAIAVLEDEEEKANMDMKEIFDGFDPSRYEEEARQRWGETDAYKESMKRAKRYSDDDWKKIKAEQAAIYSEAFAAMKAGKKASDEEVMEIADRHRRSIDRWFYPCSVEMHERLADMYENDSRFAANIDKFGENLTPFLVEAIRENARRSGH